MMLLSPATSAVMSEEIDDVDSSSGAGAVAIVALHAATGRQLWRAEVSKQPLTLTPFGQHRALVSFTSGFFVLDTSPEGTCVSSTTAAPAGLPVGRICQTWPFKGSGLLLATVARADGLRAVWFNRTRDMTVLFDVPEGKLWSAPIINFPANKPEPTFYTIDLNTATTV
jgi:hypothetical protein